MRVIALEKGARGAVKIGLDSGSLFLFRPVYLPCGEAEAASLLALIEEAYAAGSELGGPAWEEGLRGIERAHALSAAEKAAILILARREHSRAELDTKLAKREVPAQDRRIVLDRLAEEGLLSDERFAEAWVRSRLRVHPEGEFSLRAALRAKGVEKDIISERLGQDREALLRGLDGLARRVFAAERRKAERKTAPKPTESEVLKRTYAKLRARGYSHADAKRVLNELTGKTNNIDEADDST